MMANPSFLGMRSVGRVRACLTATTLWVLLIVVTPSRAATDPTVIPLPDLREVRSVDVVVEGDDLHLLLVAVQEGGTEPRVLHTVSGDGGLTWRPPVIVDRGDRIVSGRGNDAQLAVRGRRLVAAWQRAGDLPMAGPMALAFSSDGGSSWSPATPPRIDGPEPSQSYLDLAVDLRGRFHVVWLDDREEKGDTQGLRHAYSTDGGRRWRGAATIDEAVCTCCWNRLHALPDGGIAVLYRDADPHDMKLAQRSADGRWRPLGAVGAFHWTFSGCPHCGGGLATVRAGRETSLHGVVWTGEEKSAGLHYLSAKLPIEQWSSPLRIADGNGRDGDLAADARQVLGVVYVTEHKEGSAIHYRRSDDRGRSWQPPQRLNAPATNADHPRIVATTKGFRVFWTERRGLGPRTLVMAMPAAG
jgi:hypothetical protein